MGFFRPWCWFRCYIGEHKVWMMSDECDKYGEHASECACKEESFEFFCSTCGLNFNKCQSFHEWNGIPFCPKCKPKCATKKDLPVPSPQEYLKKNYDDHNMKYSIYTGNNRFYGTPIPEGYEAEYIEPHSICPDGLVLKRKTDAPTDGCGGISN